MKKTIKTNEVLEVFNLLNGAKDGKLEDSDKIKVWKITRILKPVATKFEDDTKDAAEKFKEGYKDLDERLQQAQEFEKAQRDESIDASKLKMGAAEYQAFIKGDWADYNKTVSEAVKEFAEKEVEVEFEPITEEVLGKLMSSNDWSFGQACRLELLIN